MGRGDLQAVAGHTDEAHEPFVPGPDGGLEIAQHPPHDAPDQIRRAQQEQLEACDGVVLVYGQAPPGWVHSQWAFARRTLAELRRPLRTAVLDGPPPEKPPVDLRGPGILTLDCRAGFEPRVLGDFVETLRLGAAHA